MDCPSAEGLVPLGSISLHREVCVIDVGKTRAECIAPFASRLITSLNLTDTYSFFSWLRGL